MGGKKMKMRQEESQEGREQLREGHTERMKRKVVCTREIMERRKPLSSKTTVFL